MEDETDAVLRSLLMELDRGRQFVVMLAGNTWLVFYLGKAAVH